MNHLSTVRKKTKLTKFDKNEDLIEYKLKMMTKLNKNNEIIDKMYI